MRAAVQFANVSGLPSLSMRKLAQQLGVEAMSLYNHVANKDDLLDGMVDIVVSEVDIPVVEPGDDPGDDPGPGAKIGGDWKAAMRERAISAHQVLLRHPWATMLIVSRVNVGPAMLRYVDATLGCLRQAGFSYQLADQAWNAMDSHIYGFTLQELNFPFDPSEYAEVARSYLPQLPADDYPYLYELTTLVSEGQHQGSQDFEFGLDLLLDGLDRLLARHRVGPD